MPFNYGKGDPLPFKTITGPDWVQSLRQARERRSGQGNRISGAITEAMKNNQKTESGISCHGWEGPCDSKNATRRRQNTCYVDDEQNWVTLCDECMKLNHEYWDDMWRDYYSSCM